MHECGTLEIGDAFEVAIHDQRSASQMRHPGHIILRWTILVFLGMGWAKTASVAQDEARADARGTDRIDQLIASAEALGDSEFQKRKELGMEALRLAEELNDPVGKANALRMLAEADEAAGDLMSALTALKKYVALRDDLVAARLEDQRETIRLTREARQVENQMELLKRDLRIRELQLDQRLLWQNALIALLVPVVVLVFLFLRFRRIRGQIQAELELKTQEVSATRRKLDQLVMTDPATGLPTQVYLWDKLVYERRRNKRSRRPFSLAVAEIDGFDKTRADHGPDGAEFVFKSVIRAIGSVIREQDTMTCGNGDRFFILLPETNLRGALEMAERIRLEIAFRHFQYQRHNLSLTIAIGVAVFSVDAKLEAVIKTAERALAAGKAAGGNCVMPRSTRGD